MNNNACLEVCCDSYESFKIAEKAGAQRVELCSCLMVGGLSPDSALMEMIREESNLKVRCLIRPRFGDFLYSDHEVELMARQIINLKACGADGFVIGCLTPEGELNKKQMEKLISAAGYSGLTLHRCIDVSKDGIKTAKEAAELGIDTILSSGQAATCWEGRKFLKRLIDEKLPVTVMPGAGVNAEVIKKIREVLPVNTFHMSGKEIIDSKMEFRRQGVPMGLPGFDEFSIWRSSEKAIKAALKELGA